MDVELPFKAEYAKTSRANCKGCKLKISQGSLRIAAMVQSAFHDSKVPNWFHQECFFKKQRPSSTGDIDNFENLRFEDQEQLRKDIESHSSVVMDDPKKGKKRSQGSDASNDFGIEYAKSGRAGCKGCEQKISKDEIRIRKTVFDTEVGMKYGGQPLWHHVECFAELRKELGWFASGEQLPGFGSLKTADQSKVKKAVPAIKGEEGGSAIKKAKIEPKDEIDAAQEAKVKATLKKQMKTLFKFRDYAKNKMNKNDIKELLEHNNQDAITGDSEKLLDQVADLLTFGALEPCTKCGGKQLLFQKSGYLCNGQLTEWTKCVLLTKEPGRIVCEIPSVLKKQYPLLDTVKKATEVRVINYEPPSAATIAKSIPVKKEESLLEPKVKRDRPALYSMRFFYAGSKGEEKLKKRITKLGGILDKRITENTLAVVASIDDINRMDTRMQKAKKLGIHVVPVEFLDAAEAKKKDTVDLITSMSICDWGIDPSPRMPKEEVKSMKSKSIYTKSVPTSLSLKVKDGMVVDPVSGLEDVAHVYVEGKDKYNVVLGLTDIQSNKNSYYKLQLLESDSRKKYWVFRSWGRIGTTIGGNKLESDLNLNGAKELFTFLYEEKSGNNFYRRNEFVKVPGRMYPIDIDYSDSSDIKLNTNDVKSKLHPSVQNLIKLLFDIDSMKRTMMEFDLDMEKMPLGKLSQKQIKLAYKVLSELSEYTQNGRDDPMIIDATNRFYTLIPHSFGVQKPPLLESLEQIEKLREMLDSLMQIECAYSFLTKQDTDPERSSLDHHYEQLKAKIVPLDSSSEEYTLIEKYVRNTHAETHKMYELKITDVFKVERQGETRRFKPFKKLHNRKLLWHGSRITNYAGILSQGLKIAPPEAPCTGYMFGKGIYFADMVSKSANYCCTSKDNNTGLLLLAEVALGNMMECTESNYITKLPKDMHSCFGKGRTLPNPKTSYKGPDDVEIPFGKPVTKSVETSLLYNEYIVYDIAQVNIKYLLNMEFNYKY